MARGRVISQDIAKDKKVNDLSDPLSILGFTWLITFTDVEGRTYGDPAVVRSMVFPRRDDVTVSQMESYIKEWHETGLILWYEANGDKWIMFPNFEKHQPWLRKDREAPSTIPAPPLLEPAAGSTPSPLHQDAETNSELTPDALRQIDGAAPTNDGSKSGLKEIKLKELSLIAPGGASDGLFPEKQHEKRTEQAIARGIIQAGSDGDLADWPEDVREIIQEVCKLFNLKPPTRKSKSYWIASARELIDACGEWGLNAIQEYRQDFEAYMESHQGIAPHTVEGPGSLIKVVRAKTGLMRGERTKDTSKMSDREYKQYLDRLIEGNTHG